MTRYKKILHFTVPAFVFLMLMCSCASEDELIGPPDSDGAALRIGARIDETSQSRADVYVPYGEVNTGTYYLTYPQYPSGSDVAKVNFDVPAAEGIGIVTTSQGRELTWKYVRTINATTNQRATFYLDNVKPDDANSLVISSDEFKQTYKAGVLDSITGTNDLLAGTLANVLYDTEELNFELSHQMSRIKLVVIVNNNYEEGASDFIDLSDAKVTLTNMQCDVASYDRENMTLTNSPSLSDLSIVDPSVEGNGWLWKSGADSSEENDPTDTPENKSSIQTYISQNIVLPPQQVNQIENRPILTITVGANSYWGYLPASMIDEAQNPSQVTTFQFLKGYAMTIRVHVNAPERMLLFQPVEVENWANVGQQRLQGTEVVENNND